MSLRETRRVRTARDIHAAAVRLAVENGIESLTTEAIASASGVSPRTFFNYFPFKEAAIIGPAYNFPVDETEAFVTGTAPLIQDLETFLSAHLLCLIPDRELIGHVLRLSETDTKLQALRRDAFLGRRARLAEILARRLPQTHPDVIHILSHAIVGATGRAVEDWAGGRVPDLIATARRNLAMIPAAAALLEQ